MTRHRRILEVMLALAALSAAATGCGGSGAPDKAGGEGTPLVLRLGTQDRRDIPGGKLAGHFADEVRQRSGGSIRVSVTYEAAGPGPHWDQKVARFVRSGRLDLALVPSRAWDVEGVRSMRALQMPFLLQTAEQARRAVNDPSVATTMLSGLRPLGVSGLGLIPESLRHPFAVHGALRSPQDFAGAVIRAPRSDMTWALLHALGARPVDLDGPPYTSALQRGTVTAAESDLALASPARPAPAAATGNITFFPLVDVIVANSGALSRLNARDRDILRRAAADTAAWAPSSLLSDSDAGREFCKDGGRVVSASTHDLAGLAAAARPVTTELERDPGTRALIARIRKDIAGAPSAPAATAQTCAPPRGSAAANVTGQGRPTPLDGVYRNTITTNEFVAAGVDRAWAISSANGVHTITLHDGHAADAVGAQSPPCGASYTVQKHTIRFTFDQTPGCNGYFTATWSLNGSELRFAHVQANDVGGRVQFGLKPFRKIGP